MTSVTEFKAFTYKIGIAFYDHKKSQMDLHPFPNGFTPIPKWIYTHSQMDLHPFPNSIFPFRTT